MDRDDVVVVILKMKWLRWHTTPPAAAARGFFDLFKKLSRASTFPRRAFLLFWDLLKVFGGELVVVEAEKPDVELLWQMHFETFSDIDSFFRLRVVEIQNQGSPETNKCENETFQQFYSLRKITNLAAKTF